MPFIDTASLNKRLNGSIISTTAEFHEIKRADRPTVPISIKKTLSILAHESDDSQAKIAKEFGITQPSITNYSNGEVDTHLHQENKELTPILKDIASKRQNVEMSAIDALIDTMGILPSKIKNVTKARDLASIAKDLVIIANGVSGKDVERGGGNKIIFNIVPQKSIDDYEIVEGVVVNA